MAPLSGPGRNISFRVGQIMKTLKDKVVVITGAGSGIGRALAQHAARLGARLALSDISERGLEETASLLPEGVQASTHVLDVADRDAVFTFSRDVAACHGQVDVLINNAGVTLSDNVGHMKFEDFQWLFNINFWGVVHGVDAFLPHLRLRPDAHVVNLSSIFGIISVPSQSAYNASKFAVRGYTEALRQELAGTNIHVTCVHPGGIKTNIVRSGRHYVSATGEATDPQTMARRFDRLAQTLPETAAAEIISGILGNKPRVLIGNDARMLDVMARVLPAHYDRISVGMVKMIERLRK